MRTIRTLVAAAILTAVAGASADAQGKANDRTRGNSGQSAPGLAKKGGLPPGQAKKHGTDDGATALREIFSRRGYTVVRVTRDGDVRYVFYRMRTGPVRRAVVRPGRERLVFVDVPQVILREVLARLY